MHSRQVRRLRVGSPRAPCHILVTSRALTAPDLTLRSAVQELLRRVLWRGEGLSLEGSVRELYLGCQRSLAALDSFDEMAEKENLGPHRAWNAGPQVLRTLKSIYPPDLERLGLIVLNVEPIQDRELVFAFGGLNYLLA